MTAVEAFGETVDGPTCVVCGRLFLERERAHGSKTCGAFCRRVHAARRKAAERREGQLIRAEQKARARLDRALLDYLAAAEALERDGDCCHPEDLEVR